MKNIVLALVGIAAALYVAQFAWGLKTDHDQRVADEDARYNQIITERGRRVTEGG